MSILLFIRWILCLFCCLWVLTGFSKELFISDTLDRAFRDSSLSSKELFISDTLDRELRDSSESVYRLWDVVVYDSFRFDSHVERRKFLILLRRRIHKVWPYARLLGEELQILEDSLQEIKGFWAAWKRRTYVKSYQERMSKGLELKLKKLTEKEGQLLVKLIYRQTGRSLYSIISDIRNGWQAFWWNSFAYFSNISLKREYDPIQDDEDRMIEKILQDAFLLEQLKGAPSWK